MCVVGGGTAGAETPAPEPTGTGSWGSAENGTRGEGQLRCQDVQLGRAHSALPTSLSPLRRQWGNTEVPLYFFNPKAHQTFTEPTSSGWKEGCCLQNRFGVLK